MELPDNRLLAIPENYSAEYANEVYSIMEKGFKIRLDAFLEKFSSVQQTRQRLPTSLINDFPFVEFSPFRNEIFTRTQDLAMVPRILVPGSAPKDILEVGSWNGWLTKRLADQGHRVIAADIFRDELDGLESRAHHSLRNWISLQADLSDLAVFTGPFDTIIFNHCIQFLPDPELLIDRYLRMLRPGGQLLLLGVDYRGNQREREREVKENSTIFEKRHGFKMFFYPCKGYIDTGFLHFLSQTGFKFLPYRTHLLRQFKGKMNRDHSGVYFLIKRAE
jgi:2-polyprenyl-3-methyl-5-hydroxy-6-metoxy-1,4-benzoquinol methylase